MSNSSQKDCSGEGKSAICDTLIHVDAILHKSG